MTTSDPKVGGQATAAAVTAERLSLCDLLDTLAADDWRTTSLCPAWTVHEVASSIFVWHGPDRQRPARPLRFAQPGFFDGWSTPVTNAGRRLSPTNLFFPTENIIDIQHFYAVHFWKVNSIEKHPGEAPDGSYTFRRQRS